MKLSYWEYKTWLANTDFTIVGSGIVGLSCALHLKEDFPNAKIVVLEKGTFPEGASTKNAGFACFGSISEILNDLETHSGEAVVSLVQKRWEGIQLLRELLGDREMDFQTHGGYEIFPENQSDRYGRCIDQIDTINTMLEPVFKDKPFSLSDESFGFNRVMNTSIKHRFESQLDTGRMMQSLLRKVEQAGITVLNGVQVTDLVSGNNKVEVITDRFSYHTGRLMIATNGFARRLIDVPLQPARAQAVITEPIPGLKIKGTFHLEEGYYYFRNIDKRILLGGGRNLDFKGENTDEFGQSAVIQERLDQLLREVILPGFKGAIDHSWSGIMGVGKSKQPIVEEVAPGVVCGVRLGGMGVAIGSLVGREMAAMVS